MKTCKTTGLLYAAPSYNVFQGYKGFLVADKFDGREVARCEELDDAIRMAHALSIVADKTTEEIGDMADEAETERMQS
jgi:hypothetical protein